MTDKQLEVPAGLPAEKGPRLLGKWDYIGCGVLALAASPGALSGRPEGIEYAVGRYIGVLVMWGLLKIAILWGKPKLHLKALNSNPKPASRTSSYKGPIWGLVSILAGLTCWIIGDGHSVGVNLQIPESAKLVITLVGWPYIIDGVRMMIGRQSFMRYLHRYAIYAFAFLVVGGLAVLLVMWIYDSLSLKALVAVGLTAAIALLVFILRELRRSRV